MKRALKFGQFLIISGLLLAMQAAPLAGAVDAVVAQTYKADQAFEAGTVVSHASDSMQVVKSDTTNRKDVVGVVVEPADSFVSYNSTTSSLSVATSGVVVTNISTVGGNISAGDPLTVSPLSGFAMKANSAGRVLGRALTEFTDKTSGAQIRDIQDSQGKTTQVAIGQIQVTLGATDWSGEPGRTNVIVDSLQVAASQLAGRQVTSSNAMMAALVLSLAILVAGVVLFSSVSSSMHSLGRNPLSHGVIRRSLTHVILIVLGLLVASVIVAYLIIGR